MKTRFAPSPTGWMHLGNLRTALFNFLYAHNEGYKFLLRIEDTDKERSEKRYEEDLQQDLQWLHLNWDEGPEYQSQRASIYDKYYALLEQHGHAYPCFCSEENLAVMRKVQLAAGQPPRYDGTCSRLSADEISGRIARGEQPTLRFRVPVGQSIEFTDLIKGAQRFAANDIGDFIIRRRDGSAAFMFCNAIDDALMGVTHALRGDDHLNNTPRQIMILKALNLHIPHYGHFAMINGADGAPLSKRNGSLAIKDLRAMGYLPLAVANYMARLGHYYENNELLSYEQLAQQFCLSNISTSPARHDLAHLRHWQKEAMLRAAPEELRQIFAPQLDKIPVEQQVQFMQLLQENVLLPEEAQVLVDVVTLPNLEFSEEALQVIKQAGADFFDAGLEAVETTPGIDFKALSEAVKQATGSKGKELFMPLRIVLTGQLHGPELAKLITFMSQDLLKTRFAQAYDLAQGTEKKDARA